MGAALSFESGIEVKFRFIAGTDQPLNVEVDKRTLLYCFARVMESTHKWPSIGFTAVIGCVRRFRSVEFVCVVVFPFHLDHILFILYQIPFPFFI